MLIKAWDIIERSYHLCRVNYKIFTEYILLNFASVTVMVLVQIAVIPITLLSLMVNVYLGIALGIVSLILIVALILIGVIINFAFFRAISNGYMGLAPVSIWDNLKKSFKLLWKGIATMILYGLYCIWPLVATGIIYILVSLILKGGIENYSPIIKIGFLLLVVYSIVHLFFYYIRLCFSVFQAIIYGTAPIKALKESSAIVKKRWWKIFWRLLAPMLLFAVGGNLLSSILATIGEKVGGLVNFVMLILSIIIVLVITPLIMSAMIVLFHEAEKNRGN